MLKLSEKQVLNAFGIVVNQLAGTIDSVWDKVMAFKLPIALAAQNGIFSAELAGQGFTGVKDPFSGNHGYFTLYCRDYNIENLTRDLGKRFYADRVIKPYSACRATHSSIDSALKIACNNHIPTESVEEISVHVAPGVFNGFTGQPFVIGETPQIDAAFSIRYTVATALLRKGVKPAYFTDEFISDPKIHQLIDKMKLLASIPPEKPSTTEIQVRMKDGTVFSAVTEFPRGDIYRSPLRQDEIMAKYRDNVAYSQTVSGQNAEMALKLVEDLENIRDVRDIISLMG
jgi:2-methylcitrate dehydratase PrpD